MNWNEYAPRPPMGAPPKAAIADSEPAPSEPAGPLPVVGSGGGLAEAERQLDAAKAAHAENTINLHMAEDAYEASLSRLNRAKQEYEDAVESASANKVDMPPGKP